MITINNNSNWLNQQSQLIPRTIAVRTSTSELTFSDLYSAVKKTASELYGKGVKSGDHVALLFGNNERFVMNVLALWELGAIPVPLNTRLTTNEIEKLYSLSDSVYLITDYSLNGKHKFSDNINVIQSGSKNIINNDYHHSHLHSSNTALIMFTSGSTGYPKGVMLSFDNLYHSALATDTLIDQTHHDRWLASLPFYHIGGFSIITRALLAGVEIILPDSLKTNDIAYSITTHKPTLASLVPTQLDALIEQMNNPNPEMRTIFLGGGPIDKNLARKATTKNWQIVKVYGSTETCSMIASASFDDLKVDPAIGAKPMAGNQIAILDIEGKLLEPNKKGEVAVISKSVMKGYYNNESATNEKFRHEYYLTSDYGYIDDEGRLNIEGRIDDIIISGGENINPKEIEEALLRHQEVKEAVVFKMKDDKWGEVPVAAVSTQQSISVDKLLDFLREDLSSFKIPKEIFILDEIPKNEMGKVNNKLLMEKLNIK